MGFQTTKTVFEVGDKVLINGAHEGTVEGWSDRGHVAVKTENDELVYIGESNLTLVKSRDFNKVYNLGDSNE